MQEIWLNVSEKGSMIRKWLEEHYQEVHPTPNSLVTAGPKHICLPQLAQTFKILFIYAFIGGQ